MRPRPDVGSPTARTAEPDPVVAGGAVWYPAGEMLRTASTLCALVASFACAAGAGDGNAPLATVPAVDLERYAGRWFEIARYPNRFQRDCAGEVTATYTLRNDGKIRVLNECRKADGKTKSATGTAKVADAATRAKLRVTFFWPFYGNYWIIALGKDYEYAVVGEPSRKYLWILSRTPQMPEALFNELLGAISAKGYDPARLIRTPQPR